MDYDFDEIQEQLTNDSKSGGGGKKHADHHGSKTNKFIRNEFIQHNHDLRQEEARKNIEKVVLSFPQFEGNEDLRNRYLDRYIGWVKECLNQKKLIFRENKDIEVEHSRSSSKGGQNVNKVETAVRVVHEITNMAVHNEETRDQLFNKEKAIHKLKQHLSDHLEDWVAYLDGKDYTALTRYDVLEVPQNHLTF
jgi:hypothetical protein